MKPCSHIAWIGLIFVFFMTGCATVKQDRSAALMHHLEPGKIQSIEVDAVFSMDKFEEDKNLTAHPVHSNSDREILAAQIRDREPPHLHKRHDLTVFLHEGTGVLKIEGDTLPMKEGDWVTIQRGLPHQFINLGNSPARAVVIRTPRVEDDFIELPSLSAETGER